MFSFPDMTKKRALAFLFLHIEFVLQRRDEKNQASPGSGHVHPLHRAVGRRGAGGLSASTLSFDLRVVGMLSVGRSCQLVGRCRCCRCQMSRLRVSKWPGLMGAPPPSTHPHTPTPRLLCLMETLKGCFTSLNPGTSFPSCEIFFYLFFFKF